ncbi:hypothetical protein BV22DRAFT_1065062 [Leucogyrophana mollusca]|uniref:Uncharacterized protein n=1 Tax=Leucogyrophana mollusca TaxID=85980 RepID=A0ACB8BKP9_9AGAM|nr:hypothetical protein BV22DRAFT_1065062 [Leucogyrophana mollusca]
MLGVKMQRKWKGKERKWRGKEQRPGDTVMDPKLAQMSDIIVPVMGPTGVGKSTFINIAAGNPNATTVGHDLRSSTSTIQHVIVPYPDDPTRRVVFVDTPGFDDTYVDDSEILRRISVWLARSYSDNMRLAGVVYLHDISQTRMLGTPRKNFEMFGKLCGEDALGNVILATTKWSDVLYETGRSRERQLSGTFWRDMIDHGSRMAQFRGDHASAWTIVNLIIKKDPLILQIQKELVDLGKLIPETEAGNSLRARLKDLVENYKRAAAELRDENGREDDEDLQQRLQDTENQIHSLLGQIQDLRVPLSKRIMAFFGFR